MRGVLLIAICITLAILPTALFSMGRFACYDLAQEKKRPVYPRNTLLLKPFAVRELLHMLRLVDFAFAAAKIPYFLVAGSLLGWRRHSGIIPFDDDIDVGFILPVRQDAWMTVQDIFKKTKYKCIWFGGWFKIVSPYIPIMDRLAIAVDIFPLKVRKEEVLYASPVAQRKWPKERFPAGDVFPLQRVHFQNVPTFVPARPDKVLAQSYGDNFMEVGYVNNVHGSLAFFSTKLNLLKVPSRIVITTDNNIPAAEL